MFYLIKETLVPCTAEEALSGTVPFAAVLTRKEWLESRRSFLMGDEIDIDLDIPAVPITRAIVNFDSLTGSIAIPEMSYSAEITGCFAFALDEKGVVFIDDAGLAEAIIFEVSRNKKTQMPSLERFLYDFLEQVISQDLEMLEQLEQSLDKMEDEILSDDTAESLSKLNTVRGKLLDLHLHYGRLIDFGQELQENENGFFAEDNLRYFRLFTQRTERLRDTVSNLRDYTVQLRELIQTRIDEKQNRIMTLLTVITTIFTPLTLITGWYGMNFKYMPSLESRISYPIVIVVCITIVIGCILWFKKKKWL